MSAELKTFYCDVKLVGTVTLWARARNEDEARNIFRNSRYVRLDREGSVDDPNAFKNIRTTPEIGDNCS